MITATATIMTANVFFVIIPAHWELVRAKEQGREPDPEPGLRAKQRSVHNNYLTLPVVQSDHALRVDCLNDVYHREAEAAGADVLPLGSWLCESARRCTIEQEGVTLRPDGIHFRGDGAVIAARWALSELALRD